MGESSAKKLRLAVGRGRGQERGGGVDRRQGCVLTNRNIGESLSEPT